MQRSNPEEQKNSFPTLRLAKLRIAAELDDYYQHRSWSLFGRLSAQNSLAYEYLEKFQQAKTFGILKQLLIEFDQKNHTIESNDKPIASYPIIGEHIDPPRTLENHISRAKNAYGEEIFEYKNKELEAKLISIFNFANSNGWLGQMAAKEKATKISSSLFKEPDSSTDSKSIPDKSIKSPALSC